MACIGVIGRNAKKKNIFGHFSIPFQGGRFSDNFEATGCAHSPFSRFLPVSDEYPIPDQSRSFLAIPELADYPDMSFIFVR